LPGSYSAVRSKLRLCRSATSLLTLLIRVRELSANRLQLFPSFNGRDKGRVILLAKFDASHYALSCNRAVFRFMYRRAAKFWIQDNTFQCSGAVSCLGRRAL
jgi:hypothetical protein